MVPDSIAKAPKLGMLAVSQTHGKAALVKYFTHGTTHLEEDWPVTHWFLPMPPYSILAQIQSYVTGYQAAHAGEKPNHVVLTHHEHKALQVEIGAKGVVSMVEGVKVVVNHMGETDLPKPVDMAPDLTTAMGVAPVLTDFATMEDLLHPKTLQPPIEAPLSFPAHPIFPFPKAAPTKSDVLYGIETVPGSKYIVGMDEGDESEEEEFELEPPAPAPKPTKVYHKSTSDEHGTPQALFDTLDSEFHFDLDVCASETHEEDQSPYYDPDTGSMEEPAPMLVPSNAKCPIYFTKENNGLEMDWFGTVWMNPPYTKGQVKQWIGKLVKEMLLGHLDRAVALVAARPDTEWFQFAVSHAYEIRFLKGRLTFEGSTDPAPFPSAVLLFDKTKTVQVVRFWDWKKKLAVKYFKAPGAAGGALGSAHGVIPQPLFAQMMKKGLAALLPKD